MISLRINSQAHLGPLSELPGQVATRVRDRLTFPNPAYQEAEKRGFYTGNIAQEIRGYQVDGDRLIIPRGFTRQLVEILKKSRVQYRIDDRRRTLPEVDFKFFGELHGFQVEAVEAMAARDFGTLSAPTGSGKTVMALALIASDVAQAAGNGGGVCLVLSDRKAHCEALQAALQGHGIEAHLLTGNLSNGERQAVVAALDGGEVKVLIATGQLIGEGFDCRELSTLFLATPIKFNGRLLQYLGRVLRPAPGKDKAKVYDYVDPVGVLQCAARARRAVYDRN